MRHLSLQWKNVRFAVYFFSQREALAFRKRHRRFLPEVRSDKYLIQQAVKREILLQNHFLELLKYNENGKPFLGDGRKISLSHSACAFALAWSESKETGIDIQKHSGKLVGISGKFLSPQEKDRWSVSMNDLPLLHYFWTSKEAVYKAAGIPGLSFKKHIQIHLKNNKPVKATIRSGQIIKEFDLLSRQMGDYYLSLAVEK